MEGDGFSDPRRRSARRGRGGRGGLSGTTRGSRGSSALRRGRGNIRSQVTPRRKTEDLGSNAYRYKEPEPEEENEFESGIDIEDAAAGSMADDPYTDTYKLDEDAVGALFAIELTGMEKALGSVPFWVQLGEGSRTTLGIPDNDVAENYLESLSDTQENPQGENGLGAITGDFASALAGLHFDEESDTEEGPDSEEVGSAAYNAPHSTTGSEMLAVAGMETSTLVANEPKRIQFTGSRPDVQDDFDKWLDDV